MRKLLLLSSLLTGIYLTGTAQSSRVIDSLSAVLLREKTDTGRSFLLSRLAYAYSLSQPDTALALSREALVLAESSGSLAAESFCLNTIGNVFGNKGNFPKSLEFYLMALKKAEHINEERVAIILANIATTYSYSGDNRKSLEYLFRSKEIFERKHDEYRLASTYLNIGDSYEKLDMLDSARQFTVLANDFSTKMGRVNVTAYSIVNFGNIYFKRKEPEIALAYYRSAMKYMPDMGDQEVMAETVIGMARVFQQLGRTDSSLHYARLSLKVAGPAGFTLRALEASTFLADYYRRLKIVDSAYAYLQTSIDTRDSLFNQERAREMESLGFDEDIRQQRLANEKLQLAHDHRQNIQYAAMAIGVLVFAIIFLLLGRSIVVNEKWIRFLGVLGLLLVFEFVNLFLHPLLEDITNHSPLLMLGILVAVAALLIPLHHRIEHWIVTRMTLNNRKVRLAAARKTVAKLEGEVKE